MIGRGAWTLARRELAGYFHAPIALTVAVSFLVVQGFTFWAVTKVLSDKSATVGYGAVLHTFFGGTFLHWSMVAAVVAMIGMRTIAEERRQGTWELLATAPISDGAIVVGKWLGAVCFYCLLWLPTVIFPLWMTRYLPDGVSLDVGPVVSSYLGVALIGAALLAMAVAVSSATSNQIVAAIVCFAAVMGTVVVGQLRDIAPDWLDDNRAIATWLALVDPRAHMERFARGSIEISSLAWLGGMGVVGLCAARTLISRGRDVKKVERRVLLSLTLVVVNVLLINRLAVHHPVKWDVSELQVTRSTSRPWTFCTSSIGRPGSR